MTKASSNRKWSKLLKVLAKLKLNFRTNLPKSALSTNLAEVLNLKEGGGWGTMVRVTFGARFPKVGPQ
jgi:hypothetical protein